jgi:hypothetical protein
LQLATQTEHEKLASAISQLNRRRGAALEEALASELGSGRFHSATTVTEVLDLYNELVPNAVREELSGVCEQEDSEGVSGTGSGGGGSERRAQQLDPVDESGGGAQDGGGVNTSGAGDPHGDERMSDGVGSSSRPPSAPATGSSGSAGGGEAASAPGSGVDNDEFTSLPGSSLTETPETPSVPSTVTPDNRYYAGAPLPAHLADPRRTNPPYHKVPPPGAPVDETSNGGGPVAKAAGGGGGAGGEAMELSEAL